jgi:hypothetical protein
MEILETTVLSMSAAAAMWIIYCSTPLSALQLTRK